jgi:hypothetical protein
MISMTTIMFCLPCNRLPCNQIYNVRTICENIKGRGGRDRMVVGFTNYKQHMLSALITTKVVSSNPTYGEVYSIQPYVIKLVGEFGQVGSFI